MAKDCPVYKRKVLYLDCLECDDRRCENTDNVPETGENNNNIPNEKEKGE